MAKLPKIVWHRLRRTSIAPGPSGVDTAASMISNAVRHPDANLLAAFLERSLTKRERELVLKHLADCVECREQVALALPETRLHTPATESLSPMRLRPAWHFWQVVRWSALAASLAVIGVVVVLHHPESNNVRTSLTLAPENKPAAAIAKQKAVAGETTSAAGGAAPAAAKTERLTLESPVARKVDKPSGKEQAETSGEVSKLQVHEMKDGERRAASRAPGAPLREEAKEANKPAPSVSSSSARALRSRPELRDLDAAAGPTATEKRSAVIGGVLPARQIAKAREDESERAKSAQAAGAAGKKAATAASEEAQNALKAKAPAGATGLLSGMNTYSRADQLRPTGQFSAAGTDTARTPDIAAGRWTISSSGKVEHSQDGGKTWRSVDIENGTSFRALAVVGAEVWVGGTGGALYHSTDNGIHWTRVSLTSEQVSLGDILAISFTDPTHGSVTTSAGGTWITADAGQHWGRKQ